MQDTKNCYSFANFEVKIKKLLIRHDTNMKTHHYTQLVSLNSTKYTRIEKVPAMISSLYCSQSHKSAMFVV